MNKGKHLTYSDRCKIEEMITKRKRKGEISDELEKSASTIAREIEKHKLLKPYNALNNNFFNCKYFQDCKVCTEKCNLFKPITCIDRDRNIGACNGCSKIKFCKLEKYLYKAEIAQQNYEYTLKDSREGVNLTTTELIEIAHIICPLILKGQAPYTILQNHPEINISEKTLYNYIEMGLFKDWGVSSLELKRKVKRRLKKKVLKKRKESADYTGRTYIDYLQYISENPNIPTTEMDTIFNHQSGPYIQTFIFENTSFMIGILHTKRTADSMAKSLDDFQSVLKSDYDKLFSLILTDRGTEFAKPQQFELDTKTGKVRSKIFYCDPQQSSQKPHVENNHNFVRDILPRGNNWNNLTQEKVNLMFSHINSVPREKLAGKTPYDIFTFLYGEDIVKKLNIQKIEKDETTLTPHLLK